MSDIRNAAQKIMGIDVGAPASGADAFADNLAIALCSYFEDLRPDGDEEDGETWSPWVRDQYYATEKSIVDFIEGVVHEACASRDVEIARLRQSHTLMMAALVAARGGLDA